MEYSRLASTRVLAAALNMGSVQRFCVSVIANCNLLLQDPEVNIGELLFCVTTLEMSDFSSNLPSSKLDSSQKEQLMEQVKAQIAVANAQEILHVSRCLMLIMMTSGPVWYWRS